MPRFNRSLVASLMAVALMGSAASAADISTDTAGPLAPGKPAGVKEARIYGETVLWVAAGAAVIAGLVVLADNNNKSSTATTGTSQ